MLSLRMTSEALDHLHDDHWNAGDRSDAFVTVTAPAALDSGAAKALARQVEQHLQAGERRILVDLGGAATISNAGLRALLILGRALQRLGGVFAVCGVTGDVRRTFDITGFNRVLAVYRDEIEAEAAMRLERGENEGRRGRMAA